MKFVNINGAIDSCIYMWRRGVLKSIDCLSIGIIEYIFGMENQQLINY